MPGKDNDRVARSESTVLSIVIPCRDAGWMLARQLEALASQQWICPWEVIIADNGCRDDTRAVAERYRTRLPSLRIVDAADGRGRQHACNRGAACASDAIVFVDADDEVAPGFVAAIGEALLRHPIVAARIDHESLNSGWVLEGRSDAQTRGLQDGFGFLPFGSGGTLGIRHSVFDQLGGLSDNMFYAEDVDLCWRAQLAGISIHFESDAVVRYQYRPSLRAMCRQHRNFGRASVLLYRTYRDQGLQRRSTADAAKEWKLLIKGLVRMRSRSEAARWARRLGRCAGRLEGSVRQRTWFP